MTPESKAKLEARAEKEHYTSMVDWMSGAQAAWKMATELAVKAERERILSNLLTRLESYTLDEVDLKTVINPPTKESK